MKISDLLTSLAGSAKDLEAQIEAWNKSLSAQGDQALAKMKEWQKGAERRGEEWKAEFKAYSDDVDANLKSQWSELQAGFDNQMNAARTQVSAWRAEAEQKDADTRAKWYEAYAANMVAIARRTEQEATSAIAAAAEARAKAQHQKKA